MPGLSHPVRSEISLPQAQAVSRYRQAQALWLALQILEPEPTIAMLESIADRARALTSVVVLRPDEGLLLEVRGSLRYFSGLETIRQALLQELEQRGWSGRLAVAPTPLAAAWMARCRSAEVLKPGALAGVLGSLPLAATAWPEPVLNLLGQMGLRSIADCLRLPRAGFARRVGRSWLDELDRALGKLPDFRPVWQAPARLGRCVEFSLETCDQTLFAEALRGMTAAVETGLRQRQAQITSVTLSFRHARCSDTQTGMRYVEPVHQQARMLPPLLARIERLSLAEPAIALSLETSILLPLRSDPPALQLPVPGAPEEPATVPGADLALVEHLRGRLGARSVFGIDAVAEHRPEYAWQRRAGQPVAGSVAAADCARADRPLWLLPTPEKWGHEKGGQSPFSGGDRAAFFSERIEGGWWDGRDVRRDYHIVTGKDGQKLWLFRDCQTQEWYLHGLFG